MEAFLLVALTIGVIWLAVRLQNTRNDLAVLRREFQQLQEELFKQRRKQDAPLPITSAATSPGIEPVSNILQHPSQTPVEAESSATESVPPLVVLPSETRSVESISTILPLKPPTTDPPISPAPSVPPQLPKVEPPVAPPAAPIINWEQFMGAKLFAWLGGLAAFIGIALLIKHSFQNNWIPPEVRVALGFLTGIAFVVGGVVMKRKEYAVTAQTLCATGVLVLYAISFACYRHYQFTGPTVTFLLMVAITTTAFFLAVRMDARVVAVLGLAGGFLTPLLVSQGKDEPLLLFGYIAFLNAGLVAVALHRRWHFLVPMGVIGTVLMQTGWVVAFFSPATAPFKVFIAMAVFLGFDLFFLLAFVLSRRLRQENLGMTASALGLPFVTFGFVAFLLSHASLGGRPGVIFTFVLVADLCVLAAVLLQPRFHLLHVLAGSAAFVLLSAWTTLYLMPSLLNWALALYFVFAVLHSAFPILFQRLRPGVSPAWLGHLFPPVALLLVLIPILKESEVSWAIWPFVLLVDALAIGLAMLTASALSVLGVLLLTAIVSAAWILKVPAEITSLPSLLWIIAGFAVFFFIFSTVAEKFIQKKIGALAETEGTGDFAASRFQVPALSAILPFLLLIMVTTRLPLANPSPVFGVALLMVALLLGVTFLSGLDAVAGVALACTLALELVWHSQHFMAARTWLSLLWYFVFYAVFTVFPFLFGSRVGFRSTPWAVAALAGPLHFFLFHRTCKIVFGTDYIGLLPAVFALPMLAGLAFLWRRIPTEHPSRNALLAWFGGSALFFITMIFPVQFRHEWLTLGWALEGAALLSLFHRVPHPRLRDVGIVLLLVTFVRLTLNPAVLGYHVRSGTPVINWYLYTYGIASACLLAGGKLLAAPRDRVGGINAPAVLYSLGTILAFLLVNIEIADYFSTGVTLAFEFSGNFARDMSYSIAWALFALLLLIIGIAKRAAGARYASLGLLSVTLVKLFFHDLSRLGQLYRIGAFIAVAVTLFVSSFLYQRFFSANAAKPNDGKGQE